jgi:DnaJ-class molecular chaperone
VLTLFILGLIALAGWVISLYLWPYAPCGKCGGSGRNPGSNSRRHGQCRRCKGGGRRTRLGARTVHRGRVALADRKGKRK